MVFPSSHYSPASKTPSPHFTTHAAPTVGHLYPESIAQLVQPSAFVKLWSSHVSPASRIPFPQLTHVPVFGLPILLLEQLAETTQFVPSK